MANLRQSKEFSKFMSSIGWVSEKTAANYLYIRKLGPFSLMMKLSYPTPPIPFGQIEKLIRKDKPFKIQIQPLKIESGFKKYKYHLSKEAGHVTKTLQIDLSQSEKDILSEMK